MKAILLFALWICTLAARETGEFRYRIEPYLLGSVHVLTGVTGENWELSPTGGLGLRVPVNSTLPFNLSVTFESGTTTSTAFHADIFTLLSTVSAEWEKSWSRFRILTGLGIANMMVSGENEFQISKPFAGESENEFGFSLSAEPALLIGKLSLGTSFRERYIVSSPNPVNILSVGLVGGYRF